MTQKDTTHFSVSEFTVDSTADWLILMTCIMLIQRLRHPFLFSTSAVLGHTVVEHI